jgi:hypothetical protein
MFGFRVPPMSPARAMTQAVHFRLGAMSGDETLYLARARRPQTMVSVGSRSSAWVIASRDMAVTS